MLQVDGSFSSSRYMQSRRVAARTDPGDERHSRCHEDRERLEKVDTTGHSETSRHWNLSWKETCYESARPWSKYKEPDQDSHKDEQSGSQTVVYS